MNKTYDRTVDVRVPVSIAYNQWTQFEEFPRFMSGVEEVTQVSDTLMHWRTSIAGVVREFDAQITEQHPDQGVAWRAVDGPAHAGTVTFHRLADNQTRVHLQMEFEPEGAAESVGAAMGVVGGRIEGDLEAFKTYIEARGVESGGWRGDIEAPGG